MIRHYLLLFSLIIILNTAQAQLVSLPGECKYKIGDNLEWAKQSFNDADWGLKRLGTSTNDTVNKINIYEWFRIKIVIPSGMKTLAEKGDGIQLQLGRIDDIDQTYFNGRLIGQTGSFPPGYISQSQADRLYVIPPGEVQWDKENVIAVRIFSPDPWIGMYQGPYKYGPVQWSDFISIHDTITETVNNGFNTKLKFTNKRDAAFNGIIKYSIADKNNKELFSEKKQVQIQPLKGYETEVIFSPYKPLSEKIFKVGYQITENGSTASKSSGRIYLADKQPKIEVASEPKPVVENIIRDVFTPIPFQNQKQEGYLGKRMTRNLEERLLKIDEPGTLDGYLQRPGHHPWAGEHIGKYLETASNVWKYTHDERLKTQMDRMMFELISSQLEDGYLGTYTPDEYWTSWDVWSHKYNLYGLLAYFKATGYQPALAACKRMGDLLCTTFGNKPGQHDLILAGTHIGMAATSVLDPMVELYKYTGEKKYLDFCYYILDAWEHENGPKIISSLLKTGKVTKVGNGKAYEMLSNFVGLTNLYRVTGDEKLLNPVLIAWTDIVTNRLYITGTTSSHEYFQDEANLPAGNKDNMGEGCVTTTWIQFNQQLLAFTGDLKYINQIEKSIYNHLLGAENPESGCVSYYTPLMDSKPYTCNITCCTSSVPRGIAMIPYFTFGNIRDVPTLMIYEPASYKGIIIAAGKKTVNLSLKVESGFPEKGNADITLNTTQTAIFPLALRVPAWCNSFIATIEGKIYKGIANQSLIIDRLWKSGEKIKVSFQMPLQILAGEKSYPDLVAFQRGPQVLAFDESLNSEFLRKNQFKSTQKLLVEKPDARSKIDLLPKQWIGKQAYPVSVIDKMRNVAKQQLLLVPFADASQTGGTVKVWMPLSVIKK
jgi:DUF1680 family protein